MGVGEWGGRRAGGRQQLKQVCASARGHRGQDEALDAHT